MNTLFACRSSGTDEFHTGRSRCWTAWSPNRHQGCI